MSPRTVFVCGATGVQGGALARHLIREGSAVHALTRDPTTAKSKAIEALGVKLWNGDFSNEKALQEAIAGTDAIFLNFMPDFTDFSVNLRQAKLIMKIAKEAGVSHVLYSSHSLKNLSKLSDYGPDSMLAAIFKSKIDIEEEVRQSGFQYYTILRPAYFMTNFLAFHATMFPGLADNGSNVTALRPDTILAVVDDETLGVFPAAAINDPERFGGKELVFADELQTVAQLYEKVSKAAGRELKMIPMSDEEVEAQKATNPFIGGQLLMREMAQRFDLDEVKSLGLPLSSFDAFLEREKEAIRAIYSKA